MAEAVATQPTQVTHPAKKKKRTYVSKTGLSRDQWRAVFAEAARACGPTIGQCMRQEIERAKRKYGVK